MKLADTLVGDHLLDKGGVPFGPANQVELISYQVVFPATPC